MSVRANFVVLDSTQESPSYDDVPLNQVKLQKDQHFRRWIRKSYFFYYMILHCDLDLEDRKPVLLEDNLTHNDVSPYVVVKGSATLKISSGQTFIDILTFCCDLDLEHNNPISP